MWFVFSFHASSSPFLTLDNPASTLPRLVSRSLVESSRRSSFLYDTPPYNPKATLKMIRHRRHNRAFPPKRAMTMAVAASLTRGDNNGHRLTAVAALDDSEKTSIFTQRSLRRQRKDQEILSMSMRSMPITMEEMSMSMGTKPSIASTPAKPEEILSMSMESMGEVSMSMNNKAVLSMSMGSMPMSMGTKPSTASTPAKPEEILSMSMESMGEVSMSMNNKAVLSMSMGSMPITMEEMSMSMGTKSSTVRTTSDPTTDAFMFSKSQLTSPCTTKEQCQGRYEEMYNGGQLNGSFSAGADFPIKGCFFKGEHVYFGTGGTLEEMTETLTGKTVRIMCLKKTRMPSSSPSISSLPTSTPSTSSSPSLAPTLSVSPTTAPSNSLAPSYTPTWDTGRTLKRLVTSYKSDRSSAGIMFDVQAKNPIMIRGLSFNTALTDEVRVLVWTKKGSHVGYQSSQKSWELIVNTTVIGKGLDVPTFIPQTIFMPTAILANQIRAFYISCTDGPYQRYLLVQDGDQGDFSNEDLELFREGTAKSVGFDGSNFVPRTFSGSVAYDVITPQPTQNPTLTPSLSPTTSPSMAPVPNELLTTRLFETTTRITDDELYASYDGTMFHIFARENMVINSIAFNTYRTDDMPVQLYTRYGNCTGYDMSLAGWKLIANEVVKGQGIGNPTFIPEGAFQPLIVRRKHQQAFYIVSDGPYLRLSAGTTEDNRSDFNSDMILYEGIGKRRGIDGPSFSPRGWNGALQYGVVVIPTDMPTLSPSTSPTTPYPSGSPTDSPSSSPTQFSFRLRMHWQRGYFWQDDWSDREMYWCMECASESCEDNDDVYIDHCSDKEKQQFRKVGNTLRPILDLNLCLTYIGDASHKMVEAKLVLSGKEHIILRPCFSSRAGYAEQNFEDIKWNGEPFELHPLGREDQCITQWHHPKAQERLYPEDCRVARDEVTHLWETY